MLFPYRSGYSMPTLEKNIDADDGKGRDYICSAEGASIHCESLRQKNSCWTQLWRVLPGEATKGESLVKGKLSGERTETFFMQRGHSVLFLLQKRREKNYTYSLKDQI